MVPREGRRVGSGGEVLRRACVMKAEGISDQLMAPMVVRDS